MYFKRKLLVDVIVLAGLYTLRILAGGAAAQVEVSPWMLAFSIFMFLSLAFAKRFSELSELRGQSQKELRGRGYMVEDLDILQTVGPCSGYLAVLVFAMYIYSSELVTKLYRNPLLLWLLCPLMLYWITRVWFLARRRTLTEDPVLFAIKDRVSWYAAVIAVLLVLLASVKFPAF
jgi:4-hydroxybenzoate polyprenyltransferase